MSNKMWDKETNPAVIIKVAPVHEGQDLPVAVFIQYTSTPWYWEKYSIEYKYRKCAINKAKIIDMLHFAWKYKGESAVVLKATLPTDKEIEEIKCS